MFRYCCVDQLWIVHGRCIPNKKNINQDFVVCGSKTLAATAHHITKFNTPLVTKHTNTFYIYYCMCYILPSLTTFFLTDWFPLISQTTCIFTETELTGKKLFCFGNELSHNMNTLLLIYFFSFPKCIRNHFMTRQHHSRHTAFSYLKENILFANWLVSTAFNCVDWR